MAKAIIDSLRIGPEKNFCYLIMCPETLDAALVDPSFEFDRVMSWVNSHAQGGKTPQVKYLVATHGHWDHAGGFPKMLTRVPQAQVIAHEAEARRLAQAKIPLDKSVKDREKFFLGSVVIEALHTPGHTEGGCCYLVDNQILTGDTLFIGQCGRTDLEGGSDQKLFESLQRLKTLPHELKVRPGHDYGKTPVSTIGEEMAENPTMKVGTLEEFKALP